jgi:hypothetical protein
MRVFNDTRSYRKLFLPPEASIALRSGRRGGIADRLFFNAGIGSPLDFERPRVDDGRGN